MLYTARAYRGMVTAPHRLAAESGVAVLREGGTAVEAAVATAAAMSVLYPHMNGLGGDGFWLIHAGPRAPQTPPLAIIGCGAAGAAVTPELYRREALDEIPERGPLAANTVAGTVSSWQAALEVSASWDGALPLERLLEDAIRYAEEGFPTTELQRENTVAKRDELADVPGFAGLYLPEGHAPAPGSRFRNPALAGTLRRLARAGLDDFYRGKVARTIAADLARAGSPLTAEDLAADRADQVSPLALRLSGGQGGGLVAYNLPPPTQGLAALIILGLFDRLDVRDADGFDHIHSLVEATKIAAGIRDREISDPAWMKADPDEFLAAASLDGLAGGIDAKIAAAPEAVAAPGDTVWLGVIDGAGRAVSFIHSLYWEFGSGVVLGESGITWQNRGTSFALAEGAHNRLAPGRKPFHTNNPALALFDDGRIMPYGTMGGDGQPQTQAAVLTRYAWFGQALQRAVTAPRWLWGRTWGTRTTKLTVESRIGEAVIERLRAAGNTVETAASFDALMGHAGALVGHLEEDGGPGLIEGASDPRSDGAAIGF